MCSELKLMKRLNILTDIDGYLNCAENMVKNERIGSHICHIHSNISNNTISIISESKIVGIFVFVHFEIKKFCEYIKFWLKSLLI